MLKKNQPIIITGGHHNSALVIAQKLRELGYTIVWIGHRHTMVGDPHDSLEVKEVQAAGIPFYNLLAGKFHPHAKKIHLLRLPLGFLHAFWLLVRLRPQLILAFGGYIAVPVGFVGWLLRIPVLVFEQTTTVGRGNKFLKLLSRQNFLAWASSRPFFPKVNTQVVGLPVPEELWLPPPLKIATHILTIFITGGKQGAHAINQVVFACVPWLVKKYRIIHQTGASLTTADFDQAQKLKNALPKNLKSRYTPQTFFLAKDMINTLKQSDLVISRSGAHICYELLSLGKPAILVPLPFSYRSEQQKNAQVLKKSGLALVINQKDLNPKNLRAYIMQIFANYQNILGNGLVAKKFVRRLATSQIIEYIIR